MCASNINKITRIINHGCDFYISTNYDFCIYEADLDKLETLLKDNLQYDLYGFIPEVTKQQGKGVLPWTNTVSNDCGHTGVPPN